MNSSNFFNVAHVDLPKDAIVGLVGSKFVNGFFTKKNETPAAAEAAPSTNAAPAAVEQPKE